MDADLPPGWTPATLQELRSLAKLDARPSAAVRPLRPDQLRKLNAYAAKAAEAAGAAPPPPLPDDAPWPAVRARADVDKSLLDALGAPLSALLASGADLDGLVGKGYDAAAMVADEPLCAQLVQRFGRTNVAVAALTGSEQAVLLAGSHAMNALGLSTRALLRAVATSSTGDAREEAMAVLHQECERHAREALQARARGKLPPRHPLTGIPIVELCAAGVDAAMLTQRLGIRVEQLPAVLGVRTFEEMAPLGIVVQR